MQSLVPHFVSTSFQLLRSCKTVRCSSLRGMEELWRNHHEIRCILTFWGYSAVYAKLDSSYRNQYISEDISDAYS